MKLFSGLSDRKKLFLINTVTAILYIWVFRQVYVNYLAVSHAHYAYRVENNQPLAVFITNLIAFIPILFYKAENKVSDFITIFLYVMVHVPTVIGLQYYYKDYLFVLPYQLSYLFAFIIFYSAGHNRISQRKCPNSKYAISLKYFVAFAVIDILLIIAVFHSRMRLVSFYDVYDLRMDNMDLDPGIPGIGYLMMWMNSIIPLMIAIGCYKNNRKLIILGFSMALVYYMVNAMKSVLFIAVLSYVLYYFVKKWGLKFVFPLLTVGLHVAYLLMYFMDNEAVAMGISLIMNRTYGIASQITPMYIDVFQSHPYTYLSHVGIVNKITGMYPFGDESLGYAIESLYSGEFSNANTNFLVTDGLSSCGIPGIIIISVLFYYLLSHLNRITGRFEFWFVAASIMGAITSIANLSIFTTLLSTGLLFLMFYYRFVKINKI